MIRKNGGLLAICEKFHFTRPSFFPVRQFLPTAYEIYYGCTTFGNTIGQILFPLLAQAPAYVSANFVTLVLRILIIIIPF